MTLLKQHQNDPIIASDFGICKGYGCRYYRRTGLSAEEWQQVRDVFAVPAKSPAAERQMIKKSIALFELFVGPKTGTAHDEAGAQIIKLDTKGQMDCIDEAYNTSTYLHLLRKEGLIRLHRLGVPLRRGYYLDRWPHNTATIFELGPDDIIKGPGHYVVDSWFHENGREPEIIPASLWSTGWHPPEEKPAD